MKKFVLYSSGICNEVFTKDICLIPFVMQKYYDYESKYAAGGSEHIIPARINDDVTDQIQKYAVLAHQALNCEVYSRVDFILDEAGIPYILEVNTLPGMTPTSLFPDTAKIIGLNYNDMIEEFIDLTMENKHKK